MRDRLTLLAAELSIFALTVLGFVLSYSTLRRLAEAHSCSGWEATLWPLTVDLLVLSSTMVAMLTARRGRGPTGEAWPLAGVALATLGGNVLSAGGDNIAMALHAWPPACLVGSWHLFFRAVESGEVGGGEEAPEAGPAPEPEQAEERPAVTPGGATPAPGPERNQLRRTPPTGPS